MVFGTTLNSLWIDNVFLCICTGYEGHGNVKKRKYKTGAVHNLYLCNASRNSCNPTWQLPKMWYEINIEEGKGCCTTVK